MVTKEDEADMKKPIFERSKDLLLAYNFVIVDSINKTQGSNLL